MTSAGATPTEIANILKVAPNTIRRITRELKADIDSTNSKLAELQREITSVITVKQRAEKYAALATSAKNEAVSLGALTRIDDIAGIVTDRERMRIDKQTSEPVIQPMFLLPAGAHVGITVNQINLRPGAQSSESLTVTPALPHVGDKEFT